MHFTYPQAAEHFRTELRTWLSAHATDDIVDCSSRRGTDRDAVKALRHWKATMAEAGWTVVWPAEYSGGGARPIEQRACAQVLPRMIRADDIWCQDMLLRTRTVPDGDDFRGVRAEDLPFIVPETVVDDVLDVRDRLAFGATLDNADVAFPEPTTKRGVVSWT